MAKSPATGADNLWQRQRQAFGAVDIVSRSCPLCGDANAPTPASPYSTALWIVKTCRICGFTYMTSAPVYDALSEQMSWEKTSQIEENWRTDTRALQQSLSKKLRWRMRLLPRKSMPALLDRYAGHGNIIDLGCGGGGQLEGLSSNFVPHGIEISRSAATAANDRFAQFGGYAIAAPCLDGLREFPSAFFAAATLRSYLEHEQRPAEVLDELHRVLRPLGIAFVKVPNYASLNRRVMGSRWCGFRHPDHLNYFTPRTLKQMARKCGFDTWFGLTWRLPTSDNMWALLRRKAANAWICIVQFLGSVAPAAEAIAIV